MITVGDYTARVHIKAPGTLIYGYGPGDPVSARVVEEWGLTDDQVVLGDNYQPERPAEDDDDRDAWERYVVGQGTSEEDARAASLDDLKGMYDAPPSPEPPAWEINDKLSDQELAAHQTEVAGASNAQRPADSATKAEWIAYVVGQGADEAFANATSTTKDDLRNWAG